MPIASADFEDQSDEELIHKVRLDHDIESFEELYRRYFVLIRRYCESVLRGEDVADDATLETFQRVWTYARDFTGGCFQAWIRTIARNRCRTLAARTRSLPLPLHLAAGQDLEACDPLSVRRLKRLMAGLPAGQRLCLKMYAEGHAYEEISSRTGKPPGQVKSHIQNGLRNLRAAWNRAS